MIQWIFFDLGGTLLDDVPFHDCIYRAMLDIFNEQGCRVSMDEFIVARDLMVRKRVPVLKSLVLHFTGKESLVDSMMKDLMRRIEGKGPELQTPFPESEALLRTLKQRYELGIIANQQVVIHDLLKKLGWDRMFGVTIISEEVQLSKPDIRIFRMALDRAGCKSSEAAMVGDRVDNDVAPARRLGMKTVRLKMGVFWPQEPMSEDEVPDLELPSLKGLSDALRRLQ